MTREAWEVVWWGSLTLLSLGLGLVGVLYLRLAAGRQTAARRLRTWWTGALAAVIGVVVGMAAISPWLQHAPHGPAALGCTGLGGLAALGRFLQVWRDEQQ
jgi:H+/Cl- antiporter ClcA